MLSDKFKHYRLIFAKIIDINNPSIEYFVPGAFDCSPFATTSTFLDNSYSNDHVSLDQYIGTSGYTYVNLVPTNNLLGYYPSGNSPADYMAVFELQGSDDPGFDNSNISVIAMLKEEIRDSHDPNFVEVQKICKKDNVTDQYFVFYKVQFQNTSYHPADHIEVELILDPKLDSDCIYVDKWYLADGLVNGSECMVDRSGNNKIRFIFNDTIAIQSCSNPDYNLDLSIGYIEFCVKIKDTVSNPYDYNWEVTNPKTFFKGREYPIEDQINNYCFYDKQTKAYACDYSRQFCNCPCSNVVKPKKCWFLDLFKRKKTID